MSKSIITQSTLPPNHLVSQSPLREILQEYINNVIEYLISKINIITTREYKIKTAPSLYLVGLGIWCTLMKLII